MNRPGEQDFSWEGAVQKVREELEREFQGGRSPEAIELVARESITEFVAQDVRIMTFIPILAGKAARARLKRIG
jgi:hypothetical protein